MERVDRAAKAGTTDPKMKAELLKLQAAYKAQADAEAERFAERMTGLKRKDERSS